MSERQSRAAVLQQLQEDVLVADLRWSFFVAALFSYRHDSVLRPFPPMSVVRSSGSQSSSANHANGLLLEDRDYAAVVSLCHVDISYYAWSGLKCGPAHSLDAAICKLEL